MTDLGKALDITHKMKECRDSAKFLLRDRYCAKMKEWGGAIKEIAEAKRISETAAATMMAETGNDGMTTLLIMAALVEIMEPSPECAA